MKSRNTADVRPIRETVIDLVSDHHFGSDKCEIWLWSEDDDNRDIYYIYTAAVDYRLALRLAGAIGEGWTAAWQRRHPWAEEPPKTFATVDISDGTGPMVQVGTEDWKDVMSEVGRLKRYYYLAGG